MRIAAVFLALAAAGCSSSHTFHLKDIEALTTGESTREQVGAALGEPWHAAKRAPVKVYRSLERRVIPPFGLGFLTWPVFWYQATQTYYFSARYDDNDVLSEATLTIEGYSNGNILILLHPHSFAPGLEAGDLEPLQAIEEKGIKVRIRYYEGEYTAAEYAREFELLAPP